MLPINSMDVTNRTMFHSFDTSASALSAERSRMNIIANNLANVHSTRDKDNNLNPYVRKVTTFLQGAPSFTGSITEGVSISEPQDCEDDFRFVHDPEHPDAITAEDVMRRPEWKGREGYIPYPNVNAVKEMVDMIEANRAYEANIQVMQATRGLIQGSLQILA